MVQCLYCCSHLMEKCINAGQLTPHRPHPHPAPPLPIPYIVPPPIPVLLQCQQHLQLTQQLLQYNTHDLSLFPPDPAHHPLGLEAGVSPAPHGHECGPPPVQHLTSHQERAGVSSGTGGLDSILSATHFVFEMALCEGCNMAPHVS